MERVGMVSFILLGRTEIELVRDPVFSLWEDDLQGVFVGGTRCQRVTTI